MTSLPTPRSRSAEPMFPSRRGLLRGGAFGALGLNLFGGPTAVAAPVTDSGGADTFGPLQPPNSDGLQLPPGFTSPIVARSGQALPNGYVWHDDPDGGAVFPTTDGGWV